MNWFIRSSVDPEKYSLTIKGLAALIPTVLAFLALSHLGSGLQANDLQAVIDGVASFVTAALSFVAAGVTLWGAIRKVLVAFGWWKVPPTA